MRGHLLRRQLEVHALRSELRGRTQYQHSLPLIKTIAPATDLSKAAMMTV